MMPAVRRALVVCVLAALPFPLLTWGVHAAVDRAGSAFGAQLGYMAAALSEADRAPEPFEPPAVELAASSVVSEPAPIAALAAPTGAKGTKKTRKASRAAPVRALRISADTVLRLANGGARPRGVPVKAQGQRPEGILLLGVSGLGVGLRDGDVLVEAAGQPALAVSNVVHAVIAARANRAKEISGRFWRDGELWTLTVEQPYPELSRSSQNLQQGGSPSPRQNRGSP